MFLLIYFHHFPASSCYLLSARSVIIRGTLEGILALHFLQLHGDWKISFHCDSPINVSNFSSLNSKQHSLLSSRTQEDLVLVALPTDRWWRSVSVTLKPVYNSGRRGKGQEEQWKDSDLLLLFWFSKYLGVHDHFSHIPFSKQHPKPVYDMIRDSFDKMDGHYTCYCLCKRPSETGSGLVLQYSVLSKPVQKCLKQAAEKWFLMFSFCFFHGLVNNPVACPTVLLRGLKLCAFNVSK